MHLFEFMDQEWLPRSLRATLRDILECGNSQPFRPYYDWVAKEVVRSARAHQCGTVMELGAGTAPITRHLLHVQEADSLELQVSDLNPDMDAYRELEKSSNGRVKAIEKSVDFSKSQDWPTDALLVLSATFHHIPNSDRERNLNALAASGRPVVIVEPLNKNVASMLFTTLSLVPALLTPLRFLLRPGRLRRFLWCWLLPVAPLMFVWDGVVSCIRQWSSREWAAHFSTATPQVTFTQEQALFTRKVEFWAQAAARHPDPCFDEATASRGIQLNALAN